MNVSEFDNSVALAAAIDANGALMRIAPVGVMCAGQPDLAAQWAPIFGTPPGSLTAL